MKMPFKTMMVTVILFAWSMNLASQGSYTDYKTMVQKTSALSKEYQSLCSVKSIGRTQGGKDILVLSIGTGDKDNKPGIAVLGGIEGSHILGQELALGFAADLLENSSSPEAKSLLDKLTFYVFPNVSPDATEQFFSDLKYERIINTRQSDDDRDFLTDEDPFEDLNNDGLITMIRVSDPAGTFTESADDKRIMVPADLSKGQTGKYLIYTEGIDNDKDGSYNEDGPGGVAFNRNLSYNYEEFGQNAGLHAVSEPETKALLDFLFDHFNIYMTIAFGPQDNLGQPMKASERAGTQQPQQQMQLQQFQGPPQFRDFEEVRRSRQSIKLTAITKADEIINKLVSDKYHEITGVKGAPVTKISPGNFMEWAYFHYGRYSFSTPAWWFQVEKDKNADAAFLKFADKNKMENVFVPWTEIKHPDFPDKKTEVGGIKPFASIDPPADSIPDLITRNYKFIIAIAAMHPELEFLDVKVENQGEDIYRLTLKVHNKGLFATCAESGANNMWTRIMRLTLEPSKNQIFLSGQKIQRIPQLEGDKSVELTWLIMGKGPLKATAGAVNTGFISTTIELK